jgi:hypothetical protein
MPISPRLIEQAKYGSNQKHSLNESGTNQSSELNHSCNKGNANNSSSTPFALPLIEKTTQQSTFNNNEQ